MSLGSARLSLTGVCLLLIGVLITAVPARAQPMDAVARARLTITGSTASASIGRAVAAVPNLTGDGRWALAVGAPYANVPGRADAGEVLVVFDTPATGVVAIDDPSLRGFRIIGGPYYRAGMNVAAAGDINGDGRGDIVLTAPRYGVTCPTPMSGPCGYRAPGTAFVIYGKADTATIDLAHLRSSQGFAIKGVAGGAAGPGVDTLAGLGDFTGRGFGDVAVTGVHYEAAGRHYLAGAYVIEGGRRLRDVDLQHLGARGARIAAPGAAGRTESLAVAAAGDVNGDARPDLLLRWNTTADVVFGGRARLTVALDHLGSRGLRITGLNAGAATPMAGIGDVNGDHRDDLLLARGVIEPGGLPPAEADVVYGSRSTQAVRLSRLGTRGFAIVPGPAPAGQTLQLGPFGGLGDLTGDGRADFGIAYVTYPRGGSPATGTLSVVLGSRASSALDLQELTSGGYQLSVSSTSPGGDWLGAAFAPAGDFSAAGQSEIAVGAPGLGPPGATPGALPSGEVLLEPGAAGPR